MVVKLSDNIASRRECRSVKEQLDRLIAEDHFDIVLDFSSIKKLASGFRDVLLHATRAAKMQAEKQGKPFFAMDLPRAGRAFRVFDDREQAISRHGPASGAWMGRALRRAGWNSSPFRSERVGRNKSARSSSSVPL